VAFTLIGSPSHGGTLSLLEVRVLTLIFLPKDNLVRVLFLTFNDFPAYYFIPTLQTKELDFFLLFIEVQSKFLIFCFVVCWFVL